MVQKINTSEFKNIFDDDLKNMNNKPSIIDFSADAWCHPCKIMSPIIEELSEEYEKINFYKIDVDEEYELSNTFNIRSVPTLFFIPINGKPRIHTGSFPKIELKKFIAKYLNNE